MIRTLSIINLAGILLLAGLCAAQWVTNRQLNLSAIGLEKTRQTQAMQLADKDRAIQGDIADLDDFRARLEHALNAVGTAEAQVKSLTADRDQIAAQRAQLQSSADALQAGLEKWQAAVTQRDDALRQAAQTAEKLAAERNDAIQKFNDLAAKFNAEVAELKQANGTIQKLTTERNELVLKFNDLAAKYNAAVTMAPSTASQPSKPNSEP